MDRYKTIETDHKDLIHDVAFNHFGTRMATCSSDQYVKIWDLEEDGTWKCTSSWKTHGASVWRVAWAHPEFGQVLVTCSADRAASVWEEIRESDAGKPRSSWTKRTSVFCGGSVSDVKFAPKHLGLLMATVSTDGILRIYEFTDTMNLCIYSCPHELSCKMSLSSLSWNPSRFGEPMIAVGLDDPSTTSEGKVFIFEAADANRRWERIDTITSINEPVHDVAFAPNFGRSYHILAVAYRHVKLFALKPQSSGKKRLEISQIASFDEHQAPVWRLAWNTTGTVLASAGDDGTVCLWKANYSKTWKCIYKIKGNGMSAALEQMNEKLNADARSVNSRLASIIPQERPNWPLKVTAHRLPRKDK